jgi:hypothetical protein
VRVYRLVHKPTEQMSLYKSAPGNSASAVRFDSVGWRCLCLCRDAEAMRVAIIVGKDKLGLPILSIFEF